MAGESFPPAECGFVLDANRDRALIYGGADSFLPAALDFNVVWGFSLDADTVRWERVSDPNPVIGAQFILLRNVGGVVLDPGRDRVVSFGGEGYLAGPSPWG
jgi:hypothetical protein